MERLVGLDFKLAPTASERDQSTEIKDLYRATHKVGAGEQ